MTEESPLFFEKQLIIFVAIDSFPPELQVNKSQTQRQMSSNISIIKICEYCRQEFTAKKVTSRCCSHRCNSQLYKQTLREEKVKTAVKETKQLQTGIKLNTGIDYTSLETKEMLTINEACLILNITHVTLRRWIKDSIISSSRIGKKHLIRRSHLNGLIA